MFQKYGTEIRSFIYKWLKMKFKEFVRHFQTFPRIIISMFQLIFFSFFGINVFPRAISN